jgi:hypothetical protein
MNLIILIEFVNYLNIFVLIFKMVISTNEYH